MADERPGRLGAMPGSSGSDVAWLVVLGVIWGSAFPVIRFGILAGVAPFPLGAARFAVAAAIMAVLSLRSRGAWPAPRDAAKLALLGGVLFVGSYAALLNLGEETISSGLAAVLIGTLPMWTALFGFLFQRTETFGALGAAGIACGFLGLLVLFLPSVVAGFSSFTLGEIWVVGAAAAAGAGTVLIRRHVPGSPGTRGLTIEFTTAAAFLAALCFLPGAGNALPLNRDSVLAIVYLAVLPSGVGFAIYFELLTRVGAIGANLVSYVNPLAGVTIGVLLLAEGVTATEVAGFALVMLGLSLYQWQRSRGTRAAPGPTPAE